ncbi:MAG: hypothetical protein K8T89_21875 [Planctomycetes bacterium]|nr:hypothetical protein [Planctomycetota bacterium]
MNISRWKIMACMLGLSLGGLAICAAQSNEKPLLPISAPTPEPTEPAPLAPAVYKPAPVYNSLETKPPISVPVPQFTEIDLVVPEAPLPVAPEVFGPRATGVIGVGAVEVVVPEQLPMPREVTKPVERQAGVGPDNFDAIPLVIEQPVPVAPPALPSVPMEPLQTEPIARQPVPVPVPPSLPPIQVAPRQVVEVPDVPVPPPAVYVPQPQTYSAPQVQQTAASTASKLKMLLRLGDGKPRFEIRSHTGEDLLFKVYGEKVEMQSAPEGVKKSALAGVTASGQVRFVGPGIEGTCDQLSVLSGTGEVLLKGNVHMKTKKGKTWSEMTADKMIYQIGATGLTAPPSTNSITPVGYGNDRR